MGTETTTSPWTLETAPDVLTVQEAAKLVRVSENQIYKMIKAGRLEVLNVKANGKERVIRIWKKKFFQSLGLNYTD